MMAFKPKNAFLAFFPLQVTVKPKYLYSFTSSNLLSLKLNKYAFLVESQYKHMVYFAQFVHWKP